MGGIGCATSGNEFWYNKIHNIGEHGMYIVYSFSTTQPVPKNTIVAYNEIYDIGMDHLGDYHYKGYGITMGSNHIPSQISEYY